MFLLITRPKYDPGTHYLYYWSEIFLLEAKKRNVKYVDLERTKATRIKLHGYLAKQPVDVVILNGHGNATTVFGHDNEGILSAGIGSDLLKDKNVFIRACDCGSVLGPLLMRNGAKGFIGYTQPFIIPRDKESIHKPLEDKDAGPILECSNQIGVSLIKGKSIDDAQKDSMIKYTEKINELSASKTNSSYILPFLLWNMTSQICYRQENPF